MSQGWVKLHRQIKDHWIFGEKPFSKFEAWVDMLMMANHAENKFLLGTELVEVKRGSFVTSELKLMDHWGWSKSKVRSFLKVLENDNMIVKNTDKKKTTISIVNYCIYQDKETTKRPQKDHEETTKRPQKDTNKNEKNVKNEKNEKKNIYAEFVSMTEDEYQKLVAQHGEVLTKKMINTLDNYKGANGRQYKSDYRAILNWVADKVIKEGGGSGQTRANVGTTPKYDKSKWLAPGTFD